MICLWCGIHRAAIKYCSRECNNKASGARQKERVLNGVYKNNVVNMEFKARVSNCSICDDKYLQTRVANKTCKKDECRAVNKRKYNKDYKDRMKKGTLKPAVYKPIIYETAAPEVKLKNRFILGLT